MQTIKTAVINEINTMLSLILLIAVMCICFDNSTCQIRANIVIIIWIERGKNEKICKR